MNACVTECHCGHFPLALVEAKKLENKIGANISSIQGEVLDLCCQAYEEFNKKQLCDT